MFETDVIDGNIYWMHFCGGTNAEEAHRFLALLDQLSRSTQPFAMVFETDAESPLPRDERQKFAAWLRLQKTALRDRCAGIVRVVPTVELREQYSSKAMKVFYPVAYHVVLSREEGVAWARQKLTLSKV